MAKSGIEFKVRKWSEHGARRPFDVVALDHDNNKQHYQPGCSFSTEAGAERHAQVMEKRIKDNPETIKFIRDCWPVDGGIE